MSTGGGGKDPRTMGYGDIRAEPRQPEGKAAEPGRTPAEQRLIDLVAQDTGREWAEAHTGLILEQARAIGDL